MNSRMDRYKYLEDNVEDTTFARTNKNKKLYENMDYDVFSSNETVIDTSNEIDITRLKQMINSREDYKKNNSYRNILEDKNHYDYDYVKEYNTQKYEEKNYDINELLTQVKQEKNEKNENINSRKLINTQYDILSKLDVRSKNNTSTNNNPNDLEQLINEVIQKEENDDNEVLDLFEDLKGENTIITEGFKDENNNILPAFDDTEKDTNNIELDKEENTNKEKTFDEFLDDSIVFDDDDFEDFKNIETKHGNTLIKIIIFVLIVVACTIAIFVLDSMYHFIPF